MGIEDLIAEMQAVKDEHEALALSDILRMFNILALRDLTDKLKRLGNK